MIRHSLSKAVSVRHRSMQQYGIGLVGDGSRCAPTRADSFAGARVERQTATGHSPCRMKPPPRRVRKGRQRCLAMTREGRLSVRLSVL